jgi:peroxiredoxin
MSLKVSIGEQLPSIGLRATDGYLLNLRSYVTRQPSILLFYGAPTLSGAARERGEAAAQAIADGFPRLAAAGVGAFGITCDSETQQTEYLATAKLPFLLLSDERRSAVEALGIATTRDGENVNAEPTAIAVGVDGTILDIVERAEPRGLVARLLDAFREPDGDAAPSVAARAPA